MTCGPFAPARRVSASASGSSSFVAPPVGVALGVPVGAAGVVEAVAVAVAVAVASGDALGADVVGWSDVGSAAGSEVSDEVVVVGAAVTVCVAAGPASRAPWVAPQPASTVARASAPAVVVRRTVVVRRMGSPRGSGSWSGWTARQCRRVSRPSGCVPAASDANPVAAVGGRP
ncbi:hypothetical protein GCM10025868_07280 [Angustibacter aerolatus]|uniref:Uncharacterized protein n=1 Tax=Angustibacter aerolatus TaxID=1162965 RepID=A0ABQ6JBC8_9ACTN|nr:hypothetical protein GCM10025868_07280 [Angustibacter aerolatus]